MEEKGKAAPIPCVCVKVGVALRQVNVLLDRQALRQLTHAIFMYK